MSGYNNTTKVTNQIKSIAVSVKKALIWTHCEYLEIQTKIEFKNFQKKPTAKSITSYSDFRQTT